MRSRAWLLLATLTSVVGQPELTARQRQAAGTPPSVPDLVYVCPMPEDAGVASHEPGGCPRCGMLLQPARITEGYSCTRHEAILRDKPGLCPIDKQPLSPVVVSVFWTCAADPGTKEMSPGNCADGTRRVKGLERRPHGDHNPRHGGQLFMADTGWHHVEGTLPSERLFRAYFYDELTRPLAAGQFTARVVITDATGTVLESVPARNGSLSNTLEAPLTKRVFPVRASLRIRFSRADKERRFDFLFPDVTASPPNEARTAQQANPAVRPGADAIAGAKTTSTRDLLSRLDSLDKNLQRLATAGALAQVWKPALDAKDVALELEDRLPERPAARRAIAAVAIRQLVQSAWEIDAFGDMGDSTRLSPACAAFAAAIVALKGEYAAGQ